MKKLQTSAFTIVELLIVIVVIAILAAIVVVAFNGVQRSAAIASLQSELKQASTKLELAKVDATDGNYPSSLSSIGITDTDTTKFQYTRTTSPKGYCLTATTTAQANTPPYHISNTNQEPTEGLCEGHTDPNAEDDSPSILYLQNVTKNNCPSTRTMAVDARDNHTYWIKRITNESPAYNECWMLTNLAYGGGTANGGNNNYSDVIPTGDGSNGTLNGPDNAGSTTYTLAKYYAHSSANPTTYPDEPSTSADGGATNPQYGYLYNWCAAMGAQNGGTKPSTAACANATTPAPNQTLSICPAGWRLPTGGSGGEFQLLANAIGATGNAAGFLILRDTWMAQLNGYWYIYGHVNLNARGYIWSSSLLSISTSNAYFLYFLSSNVSPAQHQGKDLGSAVRCLAI